MNKYRINLYPPELRPQPLHLSLNQIAQILIATLLLLALITGGSYWHYLNISTELNELKNAQDDQQQNIATLKQKLARHTPTPALQKQIATLEAQLHLNALLQQQLGRLQLKGSKGYGEALSELAQTKMDNLWLTGISFDEEQMNLKGKALSSNALPTWLLEFQDFNALKGRQFKTVQLQRSDNLLEFSLMSTEPPQEKP